MTVYRLSFSAPRVAPDAWVAPGAHVVGEVEVGGVYAGKAGLYARELVTEAFHG